MSQIDKAHQFAVLHKSSDPLFLYNIWDAGGAKILTNAGASAIATGSMSLALAHGYQDGQQMPLELVLAIVTRICNVTDLPVTVDFEAGYADSRVELAANITRLLATGAVGLNFEDQLVGGDGIQSIEEQRQRIAVIRATATAGNVPLFINARTDLFLRERDPNRHEALVEQAIARGRAYALAGASGFFMPGLTDPVLIRRIADSIDLPVNIMRIGTAPGREALMDAGVARISCGPGPYFHWTQTLQASFAELRSQ